MGKTQMGGGEDRSVKINDRSIKIRRNPEKDKKRGGEKIKERADKKYSEELTFIA